MYYNYKYIKKKKTNAGAMFILICETSLCMFNP